MTTRRNRNADPNAAKARAEAVFRKQEKQREDQTATDEYVANGRTAFPAADLFDT
jgi:hypothetical protein